MKKNSNFFSIPYMLWLLLFVITPVIMILWQSLFDIQGHFTLDNCKTFLSSWTHIRMNFNLILYATIITLVTLFIFYPTAYFLTRLRHKQLLLMLVVLPTWINLLLKTYTFMGIPERQGGASTFLDFIGIGPKQILFADLSLIFVASYIEIPLMILPIFNALGDVDSNLVNASRDLGANELQTFVRVVLPLSLNSMRNGAQSVFIPSSSLFMLTRLTGGNRVITLGTAIKQHFLTTQNWDMGSTIGVILIMAILATIWMTKERRK